MPSHTICYFSLLLVVPLSLKAKKEGNNPVYSLSVTGCSQVFVYHMYINIQEVTSEATSFSYTYCPVIGKPELKIYSVVTCEH